MTAARPLPQVQRVETKPAPARRSRSFHRRRRLYLSALVLVVGLSSLAAFVFFGAHMVATGDRSSGLLALGFLSGFVVLRVIGSLLTQNLRCQLCQGTVLRDRGCHKHRDADKLPMLTHRLSAALRVVFTCAFTCMYCGTPFRLKKARD